MGRNTEQSNSKKPRQYTTARAVSVKERRAFVVSLRKAGATYRQIAQATIEHFGKENLPAKYDVRAAWTDVKRELDNWQREIHEDLRDYRWFTIMRLESVLRAHWPKAMQGHLGATDRVLKVLKQEAKLMGLDAPSKLDVRVEQIDTTIERRLEKLAARSQDKALPAAGGEAEGDGETVVEGAFRPL